MALFDDLQSVVTSILNTQAPDTCNIVRLTSASDDGGGKRKTWATSSGPIKCICQPKEGRKQVEADKWEVVTDHVIFVPAATDVTSKDRVTVLARSPLPERTFRIESVLQQMGVVLELHVKLVD